MNKNYKTSSITESAMIAGILVIIAYLSSFFSVIMFFYPTPAIILAKRKGLKYAALSVMASNLIILMLLGIETGLMYFILYTPFAMALAYGICRGKDANRTILYGSASYMVSFVVLIFLMNLLMGINFIEQLKQMYNETFDMMRSMMDNYPEILVNQRVADMKKTLDEAGPVLVSTISMMFPGVLIIASVIISYVNYMVAGKFAQRFKIEIKPHEGLGYFSFPKTFMIAMAAMLLLSYIFGILHININAIQLNLFLIVFAAMYLQGIASIKMYFVRRNINKKSQNFLMVLVVFMSLFIFAGATVAIAVLGLIDLTFDLRKLNKIV